MEESLIKDYVEEIFTIQELTKKYHIGTKKVKEILIANDVSIRTQLDTKIQKKAKENNLSLKELEERIIDNYVNKQWGQRKSGLEYNVSDHLVKDILNKYNIPIRNLQESIQIANGIYDRTVQHYKKDDDFFKTESHDMAWLLGFLASDGNVKKNSNCIRIGLSNVDREILEKIKEIVHIDNPIKERQSNKGFWHVYLEWASKEQKKDLAKYGIVPAKTYILKPPVELNPEYHIDYIRGYFDGDGTINLNKSPRNSLRWGICGASKEVLEWIVEVLARYDIPPVKLHKDSSHEKDFYTITYSTNSAKKIYKILYTENSIFLKRKKDKYEYLLENYLNIE